MHHIDKLPGYIVTDKDRAVLTLVTFQLETDHMEIVSLDSFAERQGYGTLLLEQVKKSALLSGCKIKDFLVGG